MYYVLFRSDAAPGKSTTNEQYYSTARSMSGFLSETRLVDAQNPEVSFLFAQFADEEAITAWRNNQMRLGMMHMARHDILREFRLTVGTDRVEDEGMGNPGRVVVVHQRPKREDVLAKDVWGEGLDDDIKDDVENEEFYVGEDVTMWVYMLRAGANSAEFEKALARVDGDAVHRVYVAREYGKTNREQAPKGLDEAEKAAIAARGAS